jgi:dipeptidyl aminopeptidase/acylaminoacyl peptidase
MSFKFRGYSLLALAASAQFSSLCAQTAPQPASMRTTDEMAARFGARDSVRTISISPDGRQLAVVAPSGMGEDIHIHQLDGSGKVSAIKGSTGGSNSLLGCQWPTNSRLACTMYFIVKDAAGLVGYSRVIGVNADGTGSRMITPQQSMRSIGTNYFGGSIIDLSSPDNGNSVLMTRVFLPEEETGTIVHASIGGLGVIAIDTVTGKMRTIEPARKTGNSFISDGRGHVRVMSVQPTEQSGYDGNRIAYFFRRKDDRTWLPLGNVTYHPTGSEGFEPLAVDPDQDVIYGLDRHEGFTALYRRAMVEGASNELVLSHPGVDVDGLVRVGRQQRVVGATYATEKRMVDYSDPELSALTKAMAKVFPEGSSVDIIDATQDEKKLVMLVTSDTNPGMFYLFDKATRQMAELLPMRPELAGIPLARMKPVKFPAHDGTMIPGYLTLPPGSDGKGLPAIVLPHGGPESRDEWGFDWLSQFFANRGFAVLQPEFRGSTGYGSAWFQKNGFQSWQTAIGDVNDAGRWLVSQGIAKPDKLAIFGWSYGGYAALQSAVLDPDLYKAIVAVAPVTDLETLRQERLNFTDYQIENARIGQGPHVREGSPAQNAARFKAPVLMFHGDIDQNVGIGESRLMRDKLHGAGKSVELVEFPGLDHQLDNTAARTKMLARADAFLRQSLHLP